MCLSQLETYYLNSMSLLTVSSSHKNTDEGKLERDSQILIKDFPLAITHYAFIFQGKKQKRCHQSFSIHIK